ncbi:MAG: FG-GAP repeat protein, partial [Planctomycetota bacterium]
MTAAILVSGIVCSAPLTAQVPCEAAKILPIEGGSTFGGDVAMHGTLAFIGALNDDEHGQAAGAAFLFDVSDPANPIELAKLTAFNTDAFDQFGAGLGLTTDTAVVGRGGADPAEAYVFDVSDPANPVEVAMLQASDGNEDDGFGWHNAIDGDTIIAGAHKHLDKGAAYVFKDQGGGEWIEVQKLTASDGATNDRFGIAVAISGAVAVVGAYADDDAGNGSGSAYVFHEQADGNWVETHKLTASDASETDVFGKSVAIDGDLVVVLAPQADPSGAAYVFSASNGEELAKLVPEPGDWFANAPGRGVAISGTNAIVGCGSEAAYLFDLTDPSNPVQIDRITASDGADDDSFGEAVAIAGGVAIVGAWRNEELGEYTGSAYVFATPGPGVPDCGGNGIADVCEPDCDGNGLPDDCDLVSGASRDC